MELFLIALAPILQIIFSILRISGKIVIPIGIIAFLAMIAGGVFSMMAGNWVMDKIVADSPKGSLHCGMPLAAFFIGGTMMDFILAIVIAGFFTIVYYQLPKSDRAPSLI